MKISIELTDTEAAILKALAIAEKRTVKAQAEWVLGRQLQEIEEKRDMGYKGYTSQSAILTRGLIPSPEEKKSCLVASGPTPVEVGGIYFPANTVPLEIQPTCSPTPAPEESQPLA